MSHRPHLVVLALTLLAAAGLLAAPPASAAAPTITSFTPTSGKIYTPVTITGSGFTAPATVKFNGVTAPSTVVVSATRITTKVPLTASTGRISVTTAGGTATSTAVFTVTPGVTLSRVVGPPGSSVTVYFAGFGPFERVDVYLDTTDTVLATTDGGGVGNTTLTVPPATSPGQHWITVEGRHSGYAAQTPFTVRTDWPQYGYNANRVGRNPYENTLTTSNVGQLDEAWRTPSHGASYSSPVTVGGVVYATFNDGTLRAFDETTGAQKWSASIGGTDFGSPAVVGGVVYVGSNDNNLHAFNATTGAVKWTFATAGSTPSSPVVVSNVVYFGSYDGKVYAVNATTGALIWSYATGGQIFAAPAVVNGIVYAGNLLSSNNVFALNATTGTLVWSTSLSDPIYGALTAVNGRVYALTTGGVVYGLRASDGSALWQFTTTGGFQSSGAYAAGTLYVSTDAAWVYAIDAVTGAQRWANSLASASILAQGVSVTNGVVYVGDPQHTYALSAAYGGQLATLGAGTYYGAPVIVDGTLTTPDLLDGSIVHYTLNGGSIPAPASRPSVRTLHPNLTLRATT